MNTNTVIIDDLNLSKKESKEVLLSMINQQINHCKIQYLSKWERDHSTSIEGSRSMVQQLERKKSEIEDLIDTLEDESLQISFQIHVKSKKANKKRKLVNA